MSRPGRRLAGAAVLLPAVMLAAGCAGAPATSPPTTQAPPPAPSLDTSLDTAAGTWAAERGYALQDVRFEGPELEVVIGGTGPSPPGSQLLAQLRGRVPAGTPVVVSTINRGLVPIGRVPA